VKSRRCAATVREKKGKRQKGEGKISDRTFAFSLLPFDLLPKPGCPLEATSTHVACDPQAEVNLQSLSVLRRSPTADYVATIVESVFLTPTIKSVRLRLDRDEFQFLPGQSVWPKFERDGRKFSKIYSIASSPSQCPEIELCISRVGWSSAYVQDLQIGATLPLRGPYGLMTLGEMPGRPRLYIAEGSGIAPFKSQIDWLLESGFHHPIWLVQTNPETPDQLPYSAYWRHLSQRGASFHYRETTSSALDRTIASLSLHWAELDVEICAVDDRPSQIQTAVLAMGARAEQVRAEKFYAF
jgi:ferredoxin-NADP reductase